jgi:hypothetical protein
MPGELNNVTVAAATIEKPIEREVPNTERTRLFVRNQAVYVQLGYGGRAGAFDYDSDPDSRPRLYPPGSYFLDESQKPYDAIRVYAVLKADPVPPALAASVTLDCVSG